MKILIISLCLISLTFAYIPKVDVYTEDGMLNYRVHDENNVFGILLEGAAELDNLDNGSMRAFLKIFNELIPIAEIFEPTHSIEWVDQTCFGGTAFQLCFNY